MRQTRLLTGPQTGNRSLVAVPNGERSQPFDLRPGISILPFGCKPIYPHLSPLAIFFASASIPNPREGPELALAKRIPYRTGVIAKGICILRARPPGWAASGTKKTIICPISKHSFGHFSLNLLHRSDWFRLPATPTQLVAAMPPSAAACL